MSIPKEVKKKEKKSLLKGPTAIKKAALSDSGFKNYMVKEEKILTPTEFDSFISDPKRKDIIIKMYKEYLGKEIPF